MFSLDNSWKSRKVSIDHNKKYVLSAPKAHENKKTNYSAKQKRKVLARENIFQKIKMKYFH